MTDKAIEVIGKVILTENEIEITGFTFNGEDMDQSMILVMNWAFDKIRTVLNGLAGNNNDSQSF